MKGLRRNEDAMKYYCWYYLNKIFSINYHTKMENKNKKLLGKNDNKKGFCDYYATTVMLIHHQREHTVYQDQKVYE